METQFVKASREKVRFESPKGGLTVEDLWDIPLTSPRGGACLDDIAKDLNRKLKDSDTESFVVKAKKSDETLQLKFDIVKHIIDVRLKEAEEADQRQIAREKKQRLLSIIAQKEDEKLMGASLDELKAMVETL